MAKIRVLDLAQEELEKGKLLAKLKKMGVKIKDGEMAEQGTPWGATERVIRDGEGAELIEKRIKPTVIRRRAKAVEEPEKIPEEVRQEAQEAVQGEIAEVLVEEKPFVPPPTEEMEGESPAEVAEEIRGEVVEAPPEQVMPTAQEGVKPAEVGEEEKEERVQKKAKMAKKMPEEPPRKKRLLKMRVVEEAELEVGKRYPRGPRKQVVKPGKVPRKKVEFAVPKKTVIDGPFGRSTGRRSRPMAKPI